ncbi:MAG: hypothetical protein FJ095_21580 [Deltaproteobacteria bacterium]|nr:hypothetical protein [Deltaproteobacteria bacterium]
MERPQPLPDLPARRSQSAEAARRMEVERVLAMTPLERVRLALRLGRRMRRLSELATRAP